MRFEPRLSVGKVHHLDIFGCSAPGSPELHDDPDYVWDCGHGRFQETPYERGTVCVHGENPSLIYGFVSDVPELVLPEGTGLKIGGNSGFNYIVSQTHYQPHAHPHSSHDSQFDSSGVIMDVVSGHNHGITRLADVFTFNSVRPVPVGFSRQTVKCRIKEDKIIHPFKYLAHTHDLGVKVGVHLLPGGDGTRTILIGEVNPQEPQVYRPVEDDSLTIRRGDVMMSRCEYNNTRNETVYWGMRHEDEMCLLHLMYWVEGNEPLEKRRFCGFF